MPHDIPAERALLGALILDARVAPSVFELVTGDDFYAPHHANLFNTIRRMVAAGEAVDLVTVASRVHEVGLDTVGGAAWVGYPEECPSAAAASTYAKAVRHASARRTMLEALGDATRLVHEGGREAIEDIGGQVAERLLGIANRGRRRNTWSALEAWELVESEAEAVLLGNVPEKVTRVMPTGFPDLDAVLRGGLRGGDLCIVGGAPGMGKSALAMAFQLAFTVRGLRTLYLSCEPRAKEWGERLVSCATGVPHAKVDPAMARLRSQREWDAITAFYADHGSTLRASPFVFQPAMSLSQAQMHAKSAALTGQLDLVVVDHLHLMDHAKQHGERLDQAIGRTTAGLKELAGTLDCAVVCLAQMNRSSQSAETARGRGRTNDGEWWDQVALPELRDLRESGSIEQDADIVLFPVAAERAGPDQSAIAAAGHGAVLKVAKQRNGPRARVGVVWDGECLTYRPKWAMEQSTPEVGNGVE